MMMMGQQERHPSISGSGTHLANYAHGCDPKQLSPLLDDTLAAVMHSNLGGASPLECWSDALTQHQEASSLLGTAAAQQQHASGSTSKSQQALFLQQQQQQSQLQLGSSAAATATNTADPNTVLYANFRSRHPQAYAEADRLSYGSDVSTAAAAAQNQQSMLAAERAFKAQQQAQQLQQQQQLAFEAQHTLQQQQLLLAQLQQHRQQAAGPAATYNASALYGSHHSNASTLTQQQQHMPALSTQQLSSSSRYPKSHNSSVPAPSTTASRLPPRPAAAHAHHYHPYSTASGSSLLEHHAAAADPSSRHHHHHNTLVAAAAAARAAAIQQQQLQLQQQQQRSSSSSSSHSSIARQTAASAAAAAADALRRSSAGRWSGAVAVMEAQSTQQSGSADADHCHLECDEDLHSLDGSEAPHYHHARPSSSAIISGLGGGAPFAAATAATSAMQHACPSMQHKSSSSQQQQQQGAAAARHAAAAAAAARAAAAGCALANVLEEDDHAFDMYEDSGSTHPDSDNDDMDADTTPLHDQQQQHLQQQHSANKAAAAAEASAGHAAATHKALALRVLERVASKRKGEDVLTAHEGVAAAAGAASVRSRLLITEVSVYCDNAAASVLAMEQSNRLMSKMKLPDGVTYMPVHTDSYLFKAAYGWQFPAFAICLGNSYLQRMLARLPALAQAALACPGFEEYCRYLPQPPSELPPRLTGEKAVATTATLRSVLFTCLFIACKVADQVHALGLLRFILTHLSTDGMVVSLQQAIDVEARCLDALDWRLGPFFLEDDLTDEDLELWAGAMGHWNYGTTADGGIAF